MTKKITIDESDPILSTLPFRPYRSVVERRVEPFLPLPGQKQSMQIKTPWGETLKVDSGDMIVSEIKKPEDRWPVQADIFDATYLITRPGYCIKRATTLFVPLTELTDGDEDAEVTVHSLEGTYTVRAGDFFLARGIKGEIWAVPRTKVDSVMEPVDD